MDVLEAEFPAGTNFAAYIHRNSDEAFYVLEGELIMQIGDRQVKATSDSFGFAPRGVAHGFENEGSSAAKVLVWQTPAWGAERFVEALSQLPPGPPDMERLMQIFGQFDSNPQVHHQAVANRSCYYANFYATSAYRRKPWRSERTLT
jgi:hypothetical protein